MSHTNTLYILKLSCDDRPGIVAAVAGALSTHNCNIEESAQFNDKLSGQFFMRVMFAPQSEGAAQAFAQDFTSIADQFSMQWEIRRQDDPVKTLILVSKADHCLNDLLYRTRTNHLNLEITGIVSNHETHRSYAQERGYAFHYMPVSADNKAEQEAALEDLIAGTGSELIILARYMQILSDNFCRKFPGRIINIHHSFLPGFKGAKPYHQAYERGVKLIGATAHFATPDLDEGPIIEQDVMRISHSHDPKKLQMLGRDTEAKVLARAVEHFTEHRIFLHGERTVIL